MSKLYLIIIFLICRTSLASDVFEFSPPYAPPVKIKIISPNKMYTLIYDINKSIYAKVINNKSGAMVYFEIPEAASALRWTKKSDMIVAVCNYHRGNDINIIKSNNGKWNERIMCDSDWSKKIMLDSYYKFQLRDPIYTEYVVKCCVYNNTITITKDIEYYDGSHQRVSFNVNLKNGMTSNIKLGLRYNKKGGITVDKP